MKQFANPLCPEEMADPQITAERLHAGAPVYLYEGFDPPFYILSRYDDIGRVLRAPDVFISGKGQGPNFATPAGVVSDAPLHTFMRNIVQDSFQPAAIARLQPRLDEIAEECLSEVPHLPDWDLHDTIAFPLPIRIICEILGIPTDDIWQFKQWSDALVAALSSAEPHVYEAERHALTDYLLALCDRKRSTPDDSMLSRIALTRTVDGKRLSDEDVISLTLQIFVAGNETTTSLITNFVWRLCKLGLWDKFCDGTYDLDATINESLRFDPPLLGLFRTTAEDVTIAGTAIAKNSKVMTHYGAGNRDPAVYHNPHHFDPMRTGKRALSFGLGVHFCLGSELAKLEARTALAAIRRTCPGIQLIDDGQRIPPFLFWGRCKLPVRNTNIQINARPAP